MPRAFLVHQKRARVRVVYQRRQMPAEGKRSNIDYNNINLEEEQSTSTNSAQTPEKFDFLVK